MRRYVSILGLVVSLLAAAPYAEEKIDSDINWKIRREASEHSQIMKTLHMLTDVYGPRLTGSPNLRQAQDWVVQTATGWGLENAHLEAWEFGHPGWVNERIAVHVVSPVKDSLVVEALGWTPGTKGTVTAQTIQIQPPVRPTKEQLAAFFESTRASVKGKAVFVGAPQVVPVTILPSPKRREDNDLRAQYESSAPPAGQPPAPATPDPNIIPAAQLAEQLDQFLVDAGAAAPDQRCRPRARTDSRLQQPHLRRGEGGADGGDAQRGLRSPVPPDGRRPDGGARADHRQSHLSRGTHPAECGGGKFREPTRRRRW